MSQIITIIIYILISLVIPVIWLALSSVIYSRITLFFALNHIYSKSCHSCSKSDHFCFKSHHFCSMSHHFCFDAKWDVTAFLLPLFNKPAASSITYWYLWLFFITFVVGITFMVDVYCIYGQCYVYAREIELRERLPVPYDNYLKSLSSFSLCLWLIITIMGDTSLYVLFSQCSSCDNILGNCFIQLTSYSRAYVRIIYEQTKGKNPLRTSLGRQSIQVKEVYYEWF